MTLPTPKPPPQGRGAYYGLPRATSCARNDSNFFMLKTFVILSVAKYLKNLKNKNRDISRLRAQYDKKTHPHPTGCEALAEAKTHFAREGVF
ncbi:hypothetical protein [Helicobacter sp. 23-1048]